MVAVGRINQPRWAARITRQLPASSVMIPRSSGSNSTVSRKRSIRPVSAVARATPFHPLPLDRVDSIVISGSDRRGSPRHMATKGAERSDSARKFPSFRPLVHPSAPPPPPPPLPSGLFCRSHLFLPPLFFSPPPPPSPPTRIFFNRKTSSG